MPVDDAVALLVTAHRTSKAVPALHTRGPMSLDEAYRVQSSVFSSLWADDDDVAGYKISLVAPEHRANFGAAEPTFGRFKSHQLLSGSPTVPISSLHCPLVEPELVFIVNEDLGPGAGPDEVRDACSVAAGLEIPDSRFQGWFPVPDQTVEDLVSDNSFAGLVVHADETVPAAEIDLAEVLCTLSIDGESFGTGLGSAVMGDPVNAVVWLSERLARDGDRLRAGQRVSAGTFLWPPVARPGVFEAVYDRIGTVRVTFT
jgi:2-keto-4-pentenoate hydratase